MKALLTMLKLKVKGRSQGKKMLPLMLYLMKTLMLENLSDVRRDNFDFKPPKRVVGLCKYMVNCALEPSASV